MQAGAPPDGGITAFVYSGGKSFLDSPKRGLFAPLCAVNACWLPIPSRCVVAVYFHASHPRKGLHPVTKQKTYFALHKNQQALFLIPPHILCGCDCEGVGQGSTSASA